MQQARAGNELREIGHAVEKRARRAGFAVVRNLCGHGVDEADDVWTLRTPDGSRGAQFEHTMVITKSAPIVLMH